MGQDRGPRPLRDGLDQAVDRLLPTAPSIELSSGQPSRLGADEPGRPKVTALATVLGRWEEIAGATLAGHTRPVRMTGAALVVATDHPARATQVRLLSGELLARVREVTGFSPEEIRVVVRPGIGGPSTPREDGPVG